MIGRVISHYRILGLLGEGGMGTVYVAEDTRLGRRVAVKIPHAAPAADNSFHARFLREARSVSQLSHPNIATVHDYGETEDGHPFIVMELVEGRELGDLLREGGLTLKRAVEIVIEVAEALSEAHLRGVVHRDIKPSNVVVNARGAVKVLDFGLAKLVGEQEHAPSTPESETLMKFRTRSDVLVGTPLYLSPEQAKGAEVDARSDLFALGAVLYECATGQAAFSGATLMEIAAQIIHVTPPPPSALNPAVPPELDRIAMKALAKRPEERYQSAAELIEDLRRVHAQIATNGRAHAAPGHSARTQVMSPQPPTQARASALLTLSENLRRPRLSVAAVVAVLVATLGAFWAAGKMFREAPHQPLPEAERLAETGAEFLRNGAFWHAGKTLQEAVKVDEAYALAHARLAEALMEQDDAGSAYMKLLRVRQLVPNSSVLPDRDRLYLEAVTATATRDFSAAVRAYEEIARRWPAAAAYVDLGRAYERREQEGDLGRATEAYLEATRRNQNYATAFLRIGTLRARRLEYEPAETSYARAEEIYVAQGLSEGRAEVFYRRGYMLRNRGRLGDAREQLQQALEIARANGYETKQINALLQLSAVESLESDAESAAAHAGEAVELAQAAGLETLVALGLVDLGVTFLATTRYDEAEKYLRQGLDFAERNNARRVRAKAIVNLGSVYIQRGATGEGVALVEQALAFYQPGGYRAETALCFSLLGRAARDKGNYKEALEAFNRQLHLARQVDDLSQMARAHAEIGNVLLRLDDPPAALKHFDEFYQIENSLRRRLLIPYTLVLRADALWPLGRYPEARAALDEAAKIVETARGSNKDLLAGIVLTRAEMAVSQGRPEEAKRMVAQALAGINKNDKRRLAKAKQTLAVAQARSGAAVAVPACQDALAAAAETGDPALISAAQLALAEALLGAGRAEDAAATALAAREAFARAGQLESEWRAWLVAAAASRRAKDDAGARRYAESAQSALDALARKWGDEAFGTYQSRADVQAWRRQLAALLAAPRPA